MTVLIATLLLASSTPAHAHVRLEVAPSLFASVSVYFGNLHSHTSFSDGSGTPDDAYEHARRVGLDFLAITEHNHKDAERGIRSNDPRLDGVLIATTPSLYNGSRQDSLKNSAGRHTKQGEFVALYGQEFSTIGSGNHVNVFDSPEVIKAGKGQYDELYDWLKKHKDSSGKTCIVQFNHPNLFRDTPNEKMRSYGADDFGSIDEWIKKMGSVTSLMEVSSGPATVDEPSKKFPKPTESKFYEYLNLGFRVAPTGNQDNHYFTWGDAIDVRTGAWARKLDKASILDAMRNRRIYCTQDKNLRIIMSVEGVLAGGAVKRPPSDRDAVIEIMVNDDDEADAEYTFEIRVGTVGETETELLALAEGTGNSRSDVYSIEDVQIPKSASYLVVKVLQGNGRNPDQVWLAPVWFE